MMVDSLLIILTLTQIPVLFIMGGAQYCKLVSYFATLKNQTWLSDHPEMHHFKKYNRFMIGFGYLLSVASLAGVYYFVFILQDSSYYLPMFLVPGGLWMLALLLYHLAIHFGFTRKIPAPRVVSASMDNREFEAFIPRMAAIAIGIVLALILGVYAWAYFSAAIQAELAVRRIIGITGALVLGIGLIVYMLKRKHSELDKVVGHGGRKWEIQVNFYFISGLFIFVGVWRILGDFFGIHLFQDEVFFICVAVSVQVSVIIYGLHPKVREMMRDFQETYET